MNQAPALTTPETLMRRYQRGYRSALALSKFGFFIKVVGIIPALFVMFTALTPKASPWMIASSLPSTIYFAIGAFLLGTILTAQGQILLASQDAAVHSSPFLTEEEKAHVIGIG